MGTTEALIYTLPYAGLFVTWFILYVKYEERKDARKERNNG